MAMMSGESDETASKKNSDVDIGLGMCNFYMDALHIRYWM